VAETLDVGRGGISGVGETVVDVEEVTVQVVVEVIGLALGIPLVTGLQAEKPSNPQRKQIRTARFIMIAGNPPPRVEVTTI
jgi:hypothetical protein